MKNFLLIWILILLSFSVYGQGAFGEFEGIYKITESKDGLHEEYALLALEKNGKVIYKTYKSHSVISDCLGRGKMENGIIEVNLICVVNGATISHRFNVDINSSIAFYDLKFDPNGFLTLIRTVAPDGSIQSDQQYFERVFSGR